MELEYWENLPTMFFDQAEKFGDRPFLWQKTDGKWHSLKWRECAKKIAKLSEALKDFGIKPGDRVAILSENRPEWVLADLAIMTAGAIAVPLYTSYTSRDHLHVLENSAAKLAFVSTRALAQTFLPAAHESDFMATAIFMEPVPISQKINVDILSWDAVLNEQDGDVAATAEYAKTLKRDEPATIIYTSGTGGAPKGVVLHHGSLLHNCEGAFKVLSHFNIARERFLSFLPLSHAFGHMGDLFLPLSIGAEIYFAESLDKLGANMIEARPTVMLVVPRLFEMIKGRIETAVEKQGGKKAKLFERTVELGLKKLADPKSLNWGERAENKCLDILVRAKVRKRFGGKMKALVSGGAALNPDVGSFFAAMGMTLLQGYGQTETGPLISVNCPPKIKMDTVGPPVKNTSVRIAEDSEILVQGELVMKGYWNNPDATALAIRDGWLHTGDVGHFDDDGHIKITDRKKDIIVFDKGDNVSPQRIEGLLTLQPEIGQAMVYGDSKSHLVGLMVPDTEWLSNWARDNNKAADLAILKHDRDLIKAISDAVGRVNAKLSNLERVRKFILASEPFSIENEQMTPTLKIRRHVIKAVYGDQLEALY